MNGPSMWNRRVFSVPDNPVVNSRVPVTNVVASSNIGMREVAPGQLATENMKQRVGATQAKHQAFQQTRGDHPLDMSSYNLFAVGAVALFLVIMFMRSH